MLAVLLAIVAAAPSPSPQPLQTIVTTHTSPFCGAFASHVNAAISNAVDNDKALGTVMMTLHSTDLGNTTITRNNELQQLETLADSMYRAYRSGEAEVNRLRDLAKTAKDKDEQDEIKSSADALGGVLYRQHLIQRDLDGFVAYLQAGDMRRDMGPMMEANAEMLGPENPTISSQRGGVDTTYYWKPGTGGITSGGAPRVSMAGDESLADDVVLAQHAAADFRDRIPAILQDELTAGGRIAQANEHC